MPVRTTIETLMILKLNTAIPIATAAFSVSHIFNFEMSMKFSSWVIFQTSLHIFKDSADIPNTRPSKLELEYIATLFIAPRGSNTTNALNPPIKCAC